MKITRFTDDLGHPLTLAQLAGHKVDLLLNLSDAELLSMATCIGGQRVKKLLRWKKAS